MLTERDERILRILADSDRREPVRAYERDAVRDALEEIEQLRAEVARLQGVKPSWVVLQGTWGIVSQDRPIPEK